ncbi:MAG: laccase domain-containing protein, partial [Actinomycetota bacterium]
PDRHGRRSVLELLTGHPSVGVVATETTDGDLHPWRVEPGRLRRRQRGLIDRPWAMARQVHGRAIWHVPLRSVDQHDQATMPPVGPEADVVVLDRPDARPDTPSDARSGSLSGGLRRAPAVAVWAADCATALLVGEDRIVAVHAGWRGLAGGVIDAAVDLATTDGRTVSAVVAGPTIRPCCYEFSAAELEQVAAGVAASIESIAATTTVGTPALDVDAAVDAALARRSLTVTTRAPGCTGCGGRWFSHRARLDSGRHALVGWWR